MIRTRTMLVLACSLAVGCTGRGETAADDPSTDGDSPSAVTSDTAASPAAMMASLRGEIRERVGDARASDVSSCRALPFGSKPCGGPWSYLVFSVETTDSAELASLVERYNAAEERLNEAEGRMSDCAFVSRPTLEIRDGCCAAAARISPASS